MNQTSSGLQDSKTGSVASVASTSPGTIIWQKMWPLNLGGLLGFVELRLVMQGRDLAFWLTTSIRDVQTSTTIPVSGDKTVRFPIQLQDLPLAALAVAISGWTLGASTVSFDLSVYLVLAPNMPPISLAPLFNGRVVLPLPEPAAAGSSQPTAAETLARLQMLALPTPRAGQQKAPLGTNPIVALAQPSGARRQDTSYTPSLLAEGTVSYSSNTSEDLLIRPNINTTVGTTTVQRSSCSVTLDPGSAGWCTFLRWNSDELNDLSFWLHIGADFWHGGGICRWEAYGQLVSLTPTSSS